MGQENGKPTSPRGRENSTSESIRSDQARKRPEDPANQEQDLPEPNRKLGKRHD
jgi:hypothetical protein